MIQARSISGEDVVYRLAFEREDYSSDQGLHWAITCYDTYGDGDTQHAPAHQVFNTARWADALASLAVPVANVPDETLRRLDLALPYLLGDKAILWAATVKYDEAKARWYCVEERKVSTSPSRAHDRRWEAVHEWADATPQSALRILMPRGASALDKMYWIDQIEHVLDAPGTTAEWIAKNVFGGPNVCVWETAVVLADALRMFKSAVEIVRYRKLIARQAECYQINHLHRIVQEETR